MSEHFERIDSSPQFDKTRTSHEFRYYLARGFIGQCERVVEYGCGSGYGMEILKQGTRIHYVGVDKQQPADIIVDLNDIEVSVEPFDVAVSIETIEHLETPENLVREMKKARRLMIVSTPIKPTVGGNPYHKQDFTPERLIGMFEDDVWELQGWVKQLDIYGFFVFRRKGDNHGSETDNQEG